MPFVTEERWRRRSWRVACLDLVEGRAEAVVEAWGVELRKRLLHQVQAHGSIEGGLRFDLDAYSRLEWRHSETLAPFETTPGELAHLCEQGAHLTSLRLDRVPDLCEWRHELEAPAGTVFAYQPAPTPAEEAGECIRPLAVVGSYAVFAADDGRKVAHIPRPVARDRDGLNPVWGTIRIRDGISTVSFDRAALLALRLPVTIHGLDTFGYTSVGASATGYAGIVGYLKAYSPASSGDATSMSCYFSSYSSLNLAKYALYSDAAGSANAFLAETVTCSGPQAVPGWYSANFAAPYGITGGTPLHCALFSNAGMNFYYDTETGAGPFEYAAWPNFPATATPVSRDRKYSLYCTYTPTAAGALPMAMNHYRRRHS